MHGNPETTRDQQATRPSELSPEVENLEIEDLENCVGGIGRAYFGTDTGNGWYPRHLGPEHAIRRALGGSLTYGVEGEGEPQQTFAPIYMSQPKRL